MKFRQHIELPTKKLNRLSRRTPSGGLFWCGKCDANHVTQGEKCEVCGMRNGNRTMKSREL